jgi:RNase H-fold protein (predicted Holliday junction resolvase)
LEYCKFNEILVNFRIDIETTEQRNEERSSISQKNANIDGSISDFSISTETFVDEDVSTDAAERFENFLALKVQRRQTRMTRREIVRRVVNKNEGF